MGNLGGMRKHRYELAMHPEAKEDLRALPKRLQDQAILLLQELVTGEVNGKPLERELEGCRKAYFDLPEVNARIMRNKERGFRPSYGLDRNGGYRVVYRVVKQPEKSKPVLQVLAIGARDGDNSVYPSAVRRLEELAAKEAAASRESAAKAAATGRVGKPLRPQPQVRAATRLPRANPPDQRRGRSR